MPDIPALQREWHRARAELADAGFPDHGPLRANFNVIDRVLSGALWKRACDDIAEDRRKHPKAKRNQKPEAQPSGKTRFLP